MFETKPYSDTVKSIDTDGWCRYRNEKHDNPSPIYLKFRLTNSLVSYIVIVKPSHLQTKKKYLTFTINTTNEFCLTMQNVANN